LSLERGGKENYGFTGDDFKHYGSLYDLSLGLWDASLVLGVVPSLRNDIVAAAFRWTIV
jgi:hypothetical protein